MHWSKCDFMFTVCMVVAGCFIVLPFGLEATPMHPQTVRLRFIDSATGYAVQPDVVAAKPHKARGAEIGLSKAPPNQPDRALLALENGRHRITVSPPGYKPMTGDFEMTENNPYHLDIYLDPLVEPREVQQDYVAALHRPDETVFVGLVVDDDSGAPLENVLVRTEPGVRKTRSDARGHFQIYVPVKTFSFQKRQARLRISFSTNSASKLKSAGISNSGPKATGFTALASNQAQARRPWTKGNCVGEVSIRCT